MSNLDSLKDLIEHLWEPWDSKNREAGEVISRTEVLARSFSGNDISCLMIHFCVTDTSC